MQSLARYLQKLPGQTRAVSETCLYGLAAGAATVAFQLGMNGLHHLGFVKLSHQSMTTFLIGSFAIIVSSSLLVGWLLSAFCREAAGSGIPQLKLAFWKEFGTVPWRVAWVKFIAGVLSIGGGSSLGREGPSVQLAGALTSNLAGLGGAAKQSRRAPAAAGAAAGLAAAFNTPLAAATFVLEEIIGDLNSRSLGGVVLASLEPAEVQKLLKAHPYLRFPVSQQGKLVGVLMRKEAEAALAQKRPPRLEAATTCLPGQTIRQLEMLLIGSPAQMVVLTTTDGQTVLGVVTLHDLLRAEMEKARSSEE